MLARLARYIPALLMAAYVVLGGVYSVSTPIFEAPDELTHYPVVQHIASGGGLPVHSPGAPGPWQQEATQPPLYYVLAAGLTFWIDASDLPDLLWYNPHAYIGIPLADGNKNQVVHTAREFFPWRGATLAVHIVRLFSVLLGALTVLFSYLFARALAPGNPWLAAGAGALVAFNPMFLFIGSTVNNDNLMSMLSALALLWLARGLTSDPAGATSALPAGRGYALVLGAILGLAALTKLSALALCPLAGLTLLVMAWRRRSPRWLLVSGLTVSAMVAALSGWWFARNWLLYGDPTALSTLLDVMGRRASTPTLLDLVPELEGLRISFWALFGAMNVLGDPWIYRVADALTLAAIAGLVVAVVRRRAPDHLWLPVLWVAILCAALVSYSQMTLAFQGRLLFPGLQSITLLLGLGLWNLLPGRWGGRLLAASVAALAVLAVVSPFRYIAPAYPGPDLLPTLDEAAITHLVRIDYDGRARLEGYTLAPETVSPGGQVTITLYWRVPRLFDRDYSLYLHLFNVDGTTAAKRDTFPGKGAFPTRLWQPGQVFRETYRLDVSPSATGPARLRLEAGLYDPATMRNLSATDGAGRPLASSVLGYAKLRATAPSSVVPPNPLGYRLGDAIALAGYRMEASAAPDMMRLTLYWQPLARPKSDYAVFNHMLDAAGQRVAQADGDPRGGQYPTSFWDAGELIEDTYEIGAPATAAHLAVGMYDRVTGARLPVTDAQGKPVGDAVMLDLPAR